MNLKDIYYDYFRDVNPNYLEENYNIFKSTYTDPDEASAKLYDSIYKLFFYNYSLMVKNGLKCVHIVGQKYKGPLFYSFFVKEKFSDNTPDFILSVDYIGPSKFWSKEIAKLSDNHIKRNITRTRTLGGHMLWPRGKDIISINQQRGGQKSFYDRIDWTLILLKNYYQVIYTQDKNNRLQKFIAETNIPEEYSIEEERFVNLFKAFDSAREWYMKFSNFTEFCNFFKLDGSFVDKGEVKILAPLYPIEPTKEVYSLYIKENIEAIKKRNKTLENSINSI